MQFDYILNDYLQTIPLIPRIRSEVRKGNKQNIEKPEHIIKHKGFIVDIGLLFLNQHNQNEMRQSKHVAHNLLCYQHRAHQI